MKENYRIFINFLFKILRASLRFRIPGKVFTFVSNSVQYFLYTILGRDFDYTVSNNQLVSFNSSTVSLYLIKLSPMIVHGVRSTREGGGSRVCRQCPWNLFYIALQIRIVVRLFMIRGTLPNSCTLGFQARTRIARLICIWCVGTERELYRFLSYTLFHELVFYFSWYSFNFSIRRMTFFLRKFITESEQVDLEQTRTRLYVGCDIL